MHALAIWTVFLTHHRETCYSGVLEVLHGPLLKSFGRLKRFEDKEDREREREREREGCPIEFYVVDGLVTLLLVDQLLGRILICAYLSLNKIQVCDTMLDGTRKSQFQTQTYALRCFLRRFCLARF